MTTTPPTKTMDERRAERIAKLQTKQAEERAKTQIRLKLDAIRAALHRTGWQAEAATIAAEIAKLAASVPVGAPAAVTDSQSSIPFPASLPAESTENTPC